MIIYRIAGSIRVDDQFGRSLGVPLRWAASRDKADRERLLLMAAYHLPDAFIKEIDMVFAQAGIVVWLNEHERFA